MIGIKRMWSRIRKRNNVSLTDVTEDTPRFVVSAGESKETGKWHGLLERLHPPPSGSIRYILALSTTKGYDTAAKARKVMLRGLTDEVKQELIRTKQVTRKERRAWMTQ